MVTAITVCLDCLSQGADEDDGDADYDDGDVWW